MWQIDRDGRFTLGADEFIRLIGPRTAAGFGRPWREIAADVRPRSRRPREQALATRADLERHRAGLAGRRRRPLPVELSGLPVFDAARNFLGYRGFGVCRDLDGLARLARRARHESVGDAAAPQPLSADIVQAGPAGDVPPPTMRQPKTCDADSVAVTFIAELPELTSPRIHTQTDLETPVETPDEPRRNVGGAAKNVLPFRPLGEAKPPC